MGTKEGPRILAHLYIHLVGVEGGKVEKTIWKCRIKLYSDDCCGNRRPTHLSLYKAHTGNRTWCFHLNLMIFFNHVGLK